MNPRFTRCVAALALLALPLVARADERKPVRLATLAPKGSSLEKLLLALGEKLRAAPSGGLKLMVYADGKLGGEAEVVSKMRIKQIQAGLLTASGLGLIDTSILALQNLPLVYRDLDEVALVREKLAPLIRKRFEDKGFELLFMGDIGFTRFFSKEQVRVPEDLKKTKLFTLPGDLKQVDLMKGLGLNPQVLEPTDILPALQTGLVDCVPMIPFYAQVSQFYKSAPNMLELDWAPLVGGCVVLKELYDSYPEELRKAVLEAARETGEQVISRNRAEAAESVTAMKATGLKVVTPTPAEVKAWRDWVATQYPQVRGGLVEAELYDTVMETLRLHREAAPAKK